MYSQQILVLLSNKVPATNINSFNGFNKFIVQQKKKKIKISTEIYFLLLRKQNLLTAMQMILGVLKDGVGVGLTTT